MKEEDLITTKNKNSTQELIEDSITYGSSVIADKFPNIIDGLKAIQRRIVWFCRKLERPAGLTKLLGVVGEAHTGGESSIEDATIRMSQDFKVGNPLVRIDGKNGEYYDPGSAAGSRYLKAINSDFATDVFLKGVNSRTLPMTATKDFLTVEPVHLIPRLPTALILGNTTIGYGFKSKVPMIQFEDVCDMVIHYATMRRTNRLYIPHPKEYVKYMIPSFPVRNLIKNREALEEAYANEDYTVPIEMDGCVEITGNDITLKAVPYEFDFGVVTSNFRNILATKSGSDKNRSKAKYYLSYIATANQLSADEAEYLFPVKSGRNPFEAWEAIKTELCFSSSFHPIYNYSIDGKAITVNPLKLLEVWYSNRRASIIGDLNYKRSELLHEELKLRAILLVCDEVDKVISTIRNSSTTVEATEKLYKAFRDKKITYKQAEIIVGQPLATLARANKTAILNKLEQNKLNQSNNLKQLDRIDDMIIDDVSYLKKKYKTSRITRYSDEFKGYVQYGNLGIINFFDERDMLNLLKTKWSCRKFIHFYDSKYPRRYIVKNNRMEPMINPSREIWCQDVLCYPNTKEELTLCINKTDKSTSIVEKSVEGIFKDWVICPITRTFYAIHRNGTITEETVSNFTVRKNVSKGARTDLVYALPNKVENVIVFHMVASAPNIVRVDRILKKDSLGKLIMTPGNNWHVLAICPMNKKDIYLNIPDDCTKNISIQHLKICNIGKLFNDNDDHHLIDVNKASALGKKLKRHDQVRTLFTLEL